MNPDLCLTQEFSGALFEWRGPAPFFYVAVPEDEAAEIAELSPLLTYGWGVVPVQVRIGGTTWSTSLFPKDGGYLVPIKVAVRRAEGIGDEDTVGLTLSFGADRG